MKLSVWSHMFAYANVTIPRLIMQASVCKKFFPLWGENGALGARQVDGQIVRRRASARVQGRRGLSGRGAEQSREKRVEENNPARDGGGSRARGGWDGQGGQGNLAGAVARRSHDRSAPSRKIFRDSPRIFFQTP